MSRFKKNIKIAVETGILGGSLCILENSLEIASWEGSLEVSKSEDVLQAISNLFDKNSIKRESVREIIVSTAPGILTGLRIGKSITLGLRNAFDAKLKEVCLLEKMRYLSGVDVNVLTAVPVGRNKVAWQFFDGQQQDDILTGNLEELNKQFARRKIESVVAHSFILNSLKINSETEIRNAGENMARLIFDQTSVRLIT